MENKQTMVTEEKALELTNEELEQVTGGKPVLITHLTAKIRDLESKIEAGDNVIIYNQSGGNSEK